MRRRRSWTWAARTGAGRRRRGDDRALLGLVSILGWSTSRRPESASERARSTQGARHGARGAATDWREGVDACYAHLLPTTFAVLDGRLFAAGQRGLRLVTFCSPPVGAAWDACQTTDSGMVRLYEASDDPAAPLAGAVGAAAAGGCFVVVVEGAVALVTFVRCSH